MRNKTRYQFDYSKLRKRMREKYGDMMTFAITIGMSKNAVSLKFNNHNSFSQSDIHDWCDYLDIPYTEVGEYFFTPKVKQD